MRVITVNLILVGILFGTTFAIAQGWNPEVITDLGDANPLWDNFSNKNGIHLMTGGGYSPVKYVLLNSSGSVVRYHIFENGIFPNITGDNTQLFVLYWMNQTVKTWKSTNAGSTWSDEAIADIVAFDQYCSGLDAVYDNRGLHVVYSTGPSEYGDHETYYQRYMSPNWVGFKNVTDYTPEEFGENPHATTSSNKVHVSYNADFVSKTRDYNFTTETWEVPQRLREEEPSELLFYEMILASGNYLHVFYWKLIPEDFHFDLYHTKRALSGAIWNGPFLIRVRATNNNIGISATSDGKIHVVYSGQSLSWLRYRNYDGSAWSNEELVSFHPDQCGLSAVGNDLFATSRLTGETYVRYVQYDANPLAPADMTFGPQNQVTVMWAYNSEPDINNYEVWRKYYRSRFDQEDWTLKASSPSNSYTDPDFQFSAMGDNYTVYYKTKAIDRNNHYSSFSSELSTDAVMVFQKQGGTVRQLAPREFSLEQNYPNPFNPITTIDYSIPEECDVTITVYDRLGRELASVVNKEQPAGFYSATFDASKLANGVYFYTIKAGLFKATRKMLLLK